MAKKAAQYAHVLVATLNNASSKEQESIIKRFHRLVLQRGDVKLLSSIVKETEKQWESRNGNVARLVKAQEGSSPLTTQELNAQGYTVKEEQDKRLIGGTAVFLGNDYIIDNTVKGRLNQLKNMLKK